MQGSNKLTKTRVVTLKYYKFIVVEVCSNKYLKKRGFSGKQAQQDVGNVARYVSEITGEATGYKICPSSRNHT